MKTTPPLLLASLLLLGCGTEEPGATLTSSRSALTASNGTNLNGTNLNGTNLNGTNLNGTNLNGFDLNRTLVKVAYAGATRERLNGNKLDAVWIEGSEFWGAQGSSVFHGFDFDDVRFTGTLGNGNTTTVMVTEQFAPAPGGDVWRYGVIYLDAAKGTWHQLCPQPDGTNAPAIPVKGTWNYQFGTTGGGGWTDDPAHFTFACENAAIAKCIHLGYAPWRSVNGTSLASHLQACTRVIRADYCGDGTSYTQDGQLVNLYDALGVQADDQASWFLEAEWDTAGARCFSQHNRFHAHVPCYQARATPSCGSTGSFANGALLLTETPYRN